MRTILLSIAIWAALEVDTQVLLLFLALLPATGAVFFACLLLAPLVRDRRRRPQSDTRAWRGVHRARQAPGRHAPARGQRLKGVSRQAQLEERTEHLTRADVARIFDVPEELAPARPMDPQGVLARLERPAGHPDVSRAGMWSWDHPKQSGKGA